MGVFKKTRKDGSPVWYYDFMFQGIRYRGVGGTTKTQATRTCEKVREQVINEEYSHVKKMNTIYLDQFAHTFLERRKDKKSWLRDKQLVNQLLIFFKRKRLNQINSGDIEDYKIKRKNDGVTNATINRELSCLRKMYNLAIEWKEAKNNPVDGVEFLKEPPGRTRFLSKDEINTLLSHCENHIKVVVITALNTGMRLSEILNLTWKCVYLENVINPYLEIPMSKNNKKRFIPLNDTMITLLGDLRMNQERSEYVFLNKLGKQLKSVETQFKNALQKSNIIDFRFHDLRHTFASYFVMNGGDLLSLKELLGHSNMEMVGRYAHLAESHKYNLINRLAFSDKNCHLFATLEKKAVSS